MTSMSRSLRFRFLLNVERRVDLAAGLVLVIFTLIAVWNLVHDGTAISKDSVTQFYPWYSFLGESLRSGDIPAWNPSQFSGAPFAGDPLSGWTYLPAMLFFTLLPLNLAAKSYVVFHLLLAGLGTYALARILRMNVAGSLLAALAYEYSGYMYYRNVCCFAYSDVSSWLPLAILGAEVAIRSSRWIHRGLGWGLSGLALSQILASWLGQGSYYALLALGGYVAYRTLLFPPENIRGILARISGSLLHGGAVLIFGFGLAAAGVLPRLEYNSLSSLADGYEGLMGTSPTYGGWTLQTWEKLLTPGGVLYAGLPVLALALAAPVIARGRHAVPYFATLSLAALTLSGQEVTLLHSALYHVLPGFDWIHPHGPERIKVVLYLGIALLAGAAISCLGDRNRSAGAVAFLPVMTSLFLITRIGEPPPAERVSEVLAGAVGSHESFFIDLGIGVFPVSLVLLVLANVYVVVYALLPSGRRVAAALLVFVVFVDLLAAGSVAIAERADYKGGAKVVKTDLTQYYKPTGAAEFLKSRTTDGEPVRYFGYGPHQQGDGRTPHYSKWFTDPDTTALLISNLATSHGLQSIQGYNAVHLARYDEYIASLNGEPQDYHDSDVLAAGLDSPLLDLLNVRYIVVPAVTEPDQEDLKELKDAHPTAYSDDRVEVLENQDALPRAWIVHSARQVPQKETLKLLSSGAVDPEQTALLEQQPPNLASPEDPSADRASVATYGPDRIRLKTSTGAAGLLMLSEVYYPAWKAYVDGEPVPVYRADHLLRAVPVPAGEHTVELRYESWSLRIGMVISLIAYSAFAALIVGAVVQRRRKSANGKEFATNLGGL